jgi:eukaryotic-like serine/threonine-protein kinase
MVGRTIGKYRLEELVGSGAMGDVYRGRHIGLGSDVALKIMRPSVANEPKFKERFYREAKAASMLIQPNTVRVIDFGEEADGLVYLTMEFLRGRDLLTILREEWPLRDERIIDILGQTLSAISVAHHNGIVHRDLKPENIMVIADEDEVGRDHVKVCDFGIAKLVDARAFKSKEDITTALTVGHALIGTPEYMSPEQARGEPLDGRSDLYALGVILYQLMTKRLPFNAENAIGLAVKHIVEEPQPPSRVHSLVNPRLEAICMRALRKDPKDRFSTAKEMRTELRAIFGGPTSGDTSSSAHVPSAREVTESAPTLNDGTQTQQFAYRATEVDSVPGPSPVDPTPAPHAAARPEPVRLPVDSSRRMVAFGLLALLGAAGIALIASNRISSSRKDDDQPSSPTGMVQGTTSDIATGAIITPAPTLSGGETPGPLPTGLPTAHRPASTSTSVLPRPTTTTPTTTTTTAPPPPLPTTSAAPPPPTPPPPPLPTAPTPPAPAPTTEYRPTNASVTVLPLIAERVQKDVLERKIGGLMPQINGCYRDALIIAGNPVGGTATINMSVDPSGKVVSVVTSPQLPPFQRCVAMIVGSITIASSAVDPAGGHAEQILKLNP